MVRGPTKEEIEGMYPPINIVLTDFLDSSPVSWKNVKVFVLKFSISVGERTKESI